MSNILFLTTTVIDFKIMFLNIKAIFQFMCVFNGEVVTTPEPSAFDGLPYPRVRCYPHFFFHQNDKMTAKDVE